MYDKICRNIEFKVLIFAESFYQKNLTAEGSRKRFSFLDKKAEKTDKTERFSNTDN